MGNKKTVFKYFSFLQYQKEEAYLSAMNEKGWRLTSVNIWGFYHFEKCEPGQAAYGVDYNPKGLRNKEEYLQMFTDCGWEHICDCYRFSYFRKEGEAGEEREEIFCDDASRLDMMRRVFRGMYIPLIILFLVSVIPNFVLRTMDGYSNGYIRTATISDVFSYICLGLALLYLVIFTRIAFQFYKYEKQVTGNRKSIQFKLKYIGIFTLIAVMLIGTGVLFWSQNRSVYEVKDEANGYTVKADLLNTSIMKEYDLKKGDEISFDVTNFERGRIECSITEKDKDKDGPRAATMPLNHNLNSKDPIVTGWIVNEDGNYLIGITGKKATGIIKVTIE